MELRTCKKCGTEYDSKKPKCPICGLESDKAKAETGKKKQNEIGAKEPVPKWGWIIAAWITGIAVLVGIVAFVIRMGYFSPDFNFDGNELVISVEDLEKMEGQTTADTEAEEQEPADPKLCSELILSEEQIKLSEVGDRAFLNAVARPATCEEEIVYESADEAVATVTAGGMVTAEGPGTTEVIVTCGSVSKSCAIVCDFEPSEQLTEETEETEEEEETEETEETEDTEETEETEEAEQPQPEVTPADFTLRYPGEEAQLNVTNVPEGETVSYVSSNAAVVTVSATGKVTAVGNGQATITVTVGDVKLTCIARCNLGSTAEGGDEQADSSYSGPFKLSHTDVTLTTGETFNIVLMDAAGKAVSGLTWTTTNSAVCTVSGSTVKAQGKGQANVSVTYQGTTYSCIVRCSY